MSKQEKDLTAMWVLVDLEKNFPEYAKRGHEVNCVLIPDFLRYDIHVKAYKNEWPGLYRDNTLTRAYYLGVPLIFTPDIDRNMINYITTAKATLLLGINPSLSCWGRLKLKIESLLNK